MPRQRCERLLPWSNTLGAVLEKLDISPAELARRCDAVEPASVSPTLVGYYVRGRSIPSVANGYVIARALSMSIEAVFWRGMTAAEVVTAAADRSSAPDPVLADLLLAARRQLAPFARKHPRGEDGTRDVAALLDRLDVALMRFGMLAPQRECPAVAL